MRKIILSLLFCPLLAFSQNHFEKDPYAMDSLLQLQPPSPILKFSPFSLIDPLTSIQFAFEHPIGTKTSLQHELGYIIPSVYGSDRLEERGFRLRNEVRFYFDEEALYKGDWYMAPELLFIQYRYNEEGIFGQDCSGDFNCNYYRYIDYIRQKQVYALHLKGGYQLISSRFVLDVYGGLGYRHVEIRSLNRPPHQQNNWDDMFGLEKSEGFYDLPSMSFGIKLGYLLVDRRTQIYQVQN